ncbi:DUF2147 domain-containing protein [Helicobacter sp. 16-1353]|uniref:DUF2147 domain-containing protein n=1 Tax=Helicobacter sp. 16-1353 TaxID=2004996 RepID=UPI0015EED2DC|nr:DUF2147 domain-containing protein [Helicobacter sp. 16-1353]
MINIFMVNIFANDISKYDIDGIWEIPEEIEGQVSIGEIITQDEKSFAYAFAYTRRDGDKLIEREIRNEESNAKDMVGKVFLSNLEFNGKKWINGRIYNPNNGNVYYAEASLSPDKNVLAIRATIDSFGFIGVTLYWNRVKTPSYTPLSRNEIILIEALKEN